MKPGKQRFGRLSRSFGNFGELRQQKKAPRKEILYIPIANPIALNPGDLFEPYDWRSINNSSNDQLIDHIKLLGRHLEAGRLAQVDAEFLLDMIYAEIHTRVNDAKT